MSEPVHNECATADDARDLIEAAVKAEREACALAAARAGRMVALALGATSDKAYRAGDAVAAEVRARGSR